MTVKVGFIGAGNISRAHRRHLKHIDDATVVAICDVDEAKAADAAADWDARVFTDYRSMLNEVALDAVYICIPPFAHETQEILAAEKGIALFVEKPIALCMDTAREADAAIREHGVISCVGFQGRYLDIIEKTQGLLASRPVGSGDRILDGRAAGHVLVAAEADVRRAGRRADGSRDGYGQVFVRRRENGVCRRPYGVDDGRGGLRY